MISEPKSARHVVGFMAQTDPSRPIQIKAVEYSKETPQCLSPKWHCVKALGMIYGSTNNQRDGFPEPAVRALSMPNQRAPGMLKFGGESENNVTGNSYR